MGGGEEEQWILPDSSGSWEVKKPTGTQNWAQSPIVHSCQKSRKHPGFKELPEDRPTLRMSSLGITGSTPGLWQACCPHNGWPTEGQFHTIPACKSASDFWPYSKRLTSVDRARRKRVIEDPVLSSVAFKPPASLYLEKGISKDTHEHGFPMARWWKATGRAVSFWFFSSDWPLCATNWLHSTLALSFPRG